MDSAFQDEARIGAEQFVRWSLLLQQDGQPIATQGTQIVAVGLIRVFLRQQQFIKKGFVLAIEQQLTQDRETKGAYWTGRRAIYLRFSIWR